LDDVCLNVLWLCWLTKQLFIYGRQLSLAMRKNSTLQSLWLGNSGADYYRFIDVSGTPQPSSPAWKALASAIVDNKRLRLIDWNCALSYIYVYQSLQLIQEVVSINGVWFKLRRWLCELSMIFYDRLPAYGKSLFLNTTIFNVYCFSFYSIIGIDLFR
jgi:hypothetical protein